MRIYDITMPLSAELPFYPGDFPAEIAPWTRVADGDSANVSRLTLCTHAGTHIDPPRHFDDLGSPVDEIPLGLLVGKALVVAIPGVPLIGRKHLEHQPVRGVERLLLKTGNSEFWKRDGF